MRVSTCGRNPYEVRLFEPPLAQEAAAERSQLFLIELIILRVC